MLIHPKQNHYRQSPHLLPQENLFFSFFFHKNTGFLFFLAELLLLNLNFA